MLNYIAILLLQLCILQLTHTTPTSPIPALKSIPPIAADPNPSLQNLNLTTPKRTPPGGWWTETTSITCLDAESVRTRWTDQSYPPNIGPIRPGDYRILHDFLETREWEDNVRFINNFINECKECECSTGRFDRDDSGSPLLRPPEVLPEQTWCEDQEKANSCMYLYGCKCEVIISVKDDPAEPLLDALNRPFMPPLGSLKPFRSGIGRRPKRDRNRPLNPRILALMEGREKYRSAGKSDKWLVSGTEEPYWLEGPDDGDLGGPLGWVGTGLGGLEGSSLGGGIFKRGDTDTNGRVIQNEQGEQDINIKRETEVDTRGLD
ncbi:hypothetical protein TWF481_001636 [Arthrobotrys musiformis]|uniref:Uncharacterized protein n=1 Tax=Arthrobotrys musiformis TaxID=47236 RepID=A0AAV9VZY7_9PEZI